MPKISLTRNQIIIIGGILLIVVIGVVLLILGGSKQTGAAPVIIKVWGVDSADAMKPIIAGYQALRTNATIKYTQVAAGDYDNQLLTALATGKGPDVFLIGNHDLLGRGDLLAPAPAT